MWPNKVNHAKKWIGKSFGCEINFKIEGDLPVENIKSFQDQILYLIFILAISVTKILNIMKLINLPNLKVFKTGTTEEAIAVGEK